MLRYCNGIWCVLFSVSPKRPKETARPTWIIANDLARKRFHWATWIALVIGVIIIYYHLQLWHSKSTVPHRYTPLDHIVDAHHHRYPIIPPKITISSEDEAFFYSLLNANISKKSIENVVYDNTFIFKIVGEWNISQFDQRLVIGHATRETNPVNFAIFCGSARENIPSVRITVFVPSPVPSVLQHIAEMYGVVFVVYDRERLFPKYLRRIQPSSIVWFFIDYLFRRNSSILLSSSSMIVADVESTSFQLDPFSRLPPNYRSVRQPPQDVSGVHKTSTVPANSVYALVNSLDRPLFTKPDLLNQIGWCFGRKFQLVLRDSFLMDGELLIGQTLAVERFASTYVEIVARHSDMSKFLPECEAPDLTALMALVISSTGIMNSSLQRISESNLVIDLQSTRSKGLSQTDLMRQSKFVKVLIPSSDHNAVEMMDVFVAGEYGPVKMGAKWTKVAIVRNYHRVRWLYARYARNYVYWMNFTVSTGKYIGDIGSRIFMNLNTVISPATQSVNASAFVTRWLPPAVDYCSRYHVLPGTIILTGVCDIGVFEASSVESCCELCNDMAKGLPVSADFTSKGARRGLNIGRDSDRGSSSRSSSSSSSWLSYLPETHLNSMFGWSSAAEATEFGCNGFSFSLESHQCFLKSCSMLSLVDVLPKNEDTNTVSAYAKRMHELR